MLGLVPSLEFRFVCVLRSSIWLWILVFDLISQPLWWVGLQIFSSLCCSQCEEQSNRIFTFWPRQSDCVPSFLILVSQPFWRVLSVETSSRIVWNWAVVLLIRWLWNVDFSTHITASFDERYDANCRRFLSVNLGWILMLINWMWNGLLNAYHSQLWWAWAFM